MRPTPKRPPAGPLAWNDAPGGPEQLARDYMAHQINQGLKVILPSTNEYQPGEFVRSIKGGYAQDGMGRLVEIRQPFQVLRETTFEEWAANLPRPFTAPERHQARGYRFYELATD